MEPSENLDSGRHAGANWPKLLLVLLIAAVGYFLWGFTSDYSSNLYFQTSPLTEIFTSFRLAADLFVIIGLSITLLAMKSRRRMP